jgi:hypothetical protein
MAKPRRVILRREETANPIVPTDHTMLPMTLGGGRAFRPGGEIDAVTLFHYMSKAKGG